VIKMQVRDEQMVNGRDHLETTGLKQSLTHAGASIDHDLVIAGFDQDGGAIAIMRRARSTGAEERQFDLAVFGRHCEWHGADTQGQSSQ
jgi:hypothetical protein